MSSRQDITLEEKDTAERIRAILPAGHHRAICHVGVV